MDVKVLVTGGAGFIGSHIVEKLIAKGFKVVVIDNLVTGKNTNIPKKAITYFLDIKDPSLEDVFRIEKPQVVIHQAGQVSVKESFLNPLIDGNENIIGTINILNQCVKYNVRKIIYASSAAVYGLPSFLPIQEDHPILPLSFYGLSKVTAERYVQLFSSQFKLEYTILRYSNVYGNKQGNNGEAGVIPTFISCYMNGINLTIFGDGDQTRDFIYVKDVSAANLAAIQFGKNQIINISSNLQTSLNELLIILSDLFSKKIDVIKKKAQFGDIYSNCLSNKKALKELHWIPKYTLYEGLKQTISIIKDEIIR
jgi:UDP-glucose 4-epimerase